MIIESIELAKDGSVHIHVPGKRSYSFASRTTCFEFVSQTRPALEFELAMALRPYLDVIKTARTADEIPLSGKEITMTSEVRAVTR